jgi:cytochrome c2
MRWWRTWRVWNEERHMKRRAVFPAILLLAGCSGRSSESGLRGKALVTAYGCIACHEIPGVPEASGSVGPSLRGVSRRAYLAGRLSNTPPNMVRWIRNPQQVDPETAMPEMGVSAQEANDLAQFLYTLR